MDNFKKQDIEAIVAYLTGKESVEVAGIIANVGANPMRVYPIIAELHTRGKLEIVETEQLGAPKTVRLK